MRLSLSSEVSPEIREYQRFTTTCANAYVQSLIAGYPRRLERGLAEAGFRCPPFLMLSGGGITEIDTATRFPVRLIESGPAGGAVLAAKICLIDGFRPRAARSFEVARAGRFKPGSGPPLRIPVIEMVEIGAGGGSIAGVDGVGRIAVGPESAGADPGTACYARAAQRATVTDADVRLGRISPEAFAGGRMRLDAGLAEAALVRDVGAALGGDATLAALGISEIVEENMANALREHAVERCKTPAGRTLIAFGGAAPIHAARLADKVGIDRVVVPANAGVGSAVGFLEAPIAYEVARTNYQLLGAMALDSVNRMFDNMAREAHAVVDRGAPGSESVERRLGYMRYVGQGHEIPVEVPVRRLADDDAAALRGSYDAAVFRRTGLAAGAELSGWAVIVEDETSTVVPPSFTARIDRFDHIVMDRTPHRATEPLS